VAHLVWHELQHRRRIGTVVPLGFSHGRFLDESALWLNHRVVRHNSLVWNDDDAVADGVVVALGFLDLTLVDDADVLADAAVLVKDGPLDDRTVTDAGAGQAGLTILGTLGSRFILVGP